MIFGLVCYPLTLRIPTPFVLFRECSLQSQSIACCNTIELTTVSKEVLLFVTMNKSTLKTSLTELNDCLILANSEWSR